MTLLSPAAPLLCPERRRPGRRPLVDERRTLAEARTLLRHPVWRGRGVPRGDGLAVLLVPGVAAGEVPLTFLSRWLGRIGYQSYRSKVRLNVDGTHEAIDRLERRLALMAERAERPVAVIGQGHGGHLAKRVAIRRPDLVAGIISLGCPHVSASAESWPELGAPFPADVPFTSIYSRTDDVVEWRACLDPAADQVEVRSSHLGMAVHPAVYRTVGERLAATSRRVALTPAPTPTQTPAPT